MKFRFPLTAALGAIALAACSPEPATTDTAATADHGAMEGHENMAAPAQAVSTPGSMGTMPATIVAKRGGFIPEGIEYDQTNARLLTGSLAEGTIFEIGRDGSVTPFITDSDLVSSVGIEADEPHDRLLVANSDRAVFGGEGSGQAKLGVYSLTTGERLAMVDMGALLPPGAAFFANDVAVDDAGNAYATDTQRNVIYRVSVGFEPSIFYTFPATENLALNGIVYHPDGYLLVADSGNGLLYKTPIDAPAATALVRLPEPVSGDDGLVWRADGALGVVQNISPGGRVTALTSNDGWASAQVAGVAPHEGQATTGAAVGNDIYIVQPHFNDQDPPTFHRAVFQ
jgi:sugar lactone lactonase YvrE